MTGAQRENEYEISYKIVRPLAHRILDGRIAGGVAQIVDCNLTLNPDDWILNLGNGIRTTREEYVKHELAWYNSLDLCIRGHEGIENNKIWQSCATENGFVNSNYGNLVFSDENYCQFAHAVDELARDKNSRRAAIIYNRPSIVEEQNDGVHANRDFICTYATSFLIQDNVLHMQVHMRSNDFTYGFFNDFAWQCYVYNQFIKALEEHGIVVWQGNIHWHADSMHVYERDFELIKKLHNYYIKTGGAGYEQ